MSRRKNKQQNPLPKTPTVTNQAASKTNKVDSNPDSWRVAILSGVIAAIMSSILSFLFWIPQRTSEINEKLYERRLILMEQLTHDALHYMMLRQYRVKFAIIVDMKKRESGTLTPSEVAPIEDELKKLFPIEHSKSMESEDFRPNLVTKAIMAQTLFGPKTAACTKNFLDTLSKSLEDYIVEYFASKVASGVNTDDLYSKKEDGTLEVNFLVDEFVDFVDSDMHRELLFIVNAMYDEIKS